MNSPLICPVCAAPLLPLDKTYVCANKHSFDKAKQGYVNLLLSNQKNSLQPGDGKDMVKSRLAFLKQGFYQPIVEVLNNALEKALQNQPVANMQIADLGCG